MDIIKMKTFSTGSHFVIRNVMIIFILIYSLFFPDNTAKYILIGMGVIMAILNLRQEYVSKNYEK